MHFLPIPRVILPVLLLALISLVPVAASAQTQGDVDNAKTAEEQAFQALLDADEVLESNLEEMERISSATLALDEPASIAFGTGKGDRQSVFFTNYSVLPPHEGHGPAVLKLDVGVPGVPLP